MLLLIIALVLEDSVSLSQHSRSCVGTSVLNPCFQVLMTAWRENRSWGWNFSYPFSPEKCSSCFESLAESAASVTPRSLQGPLGEAVGEIWDIQGLQLCSTWDLKFGDCICLVLILWCVKVPYFWFLDGDGLSHSRSRPVRWFCSKNLHLNFTGSSRNQRRHQCRAMIRSFLPSWILSGHSLKLQSNCVLPKLQSCFKTQVICLGDSYYSFLPVYAECILWGHAIAFIYLTFLVCLFRVFNS